MYNIRHRCSYSDPLAPYVLVALKHGWADGYAGKVL